MDTGLAAATGADRAPRPSPGAADSDRSTACRRDRRGEKAAGAPFARLDRRVGHGRRPVHGDHGRPNRHQLADPDPRRLVRQPRRDRLGADLLSDRRRCDGAVVGHAVAAVVDPCAICDRGPGLHRVERAVRDGDDPWPDDPLSRHAGVQRRRDDADGISGNLYEIPPAASGVDHGDNLCDPEPVGNFGSHDRGLSDRHLLLALVISGQHRTRHFCRRRRMAIDRYRQTRVVAVAPFRPMRPRADGGVSRLLRIRARGRPALGLAFRRHDPRRGRRLGHCLGALFLAGADLSPPDRPSICAPLPVTISR